MKIATDSGASIYLRRVPCYVNSRTGPNPWRETLEPCLRRAVGMSAEESRVPLKIRRAHHCFEKLFSGDEI